MIVSIILGVHWLMPQIVIEVFASWKGRLCCLYKGEIWGAVPQCVVWTIQQEENNHTFNNAKLKETCFKLFFYTHYLIGWLLWKVYNCYYFLNFLALLTFGWQFTERMHYDRLLYFYE